jgi:hypothetical protein
MPEADAVCRRARLYAAGTLLRSCARLQLNYLGPKALLRHNREPYVTGAPIT